MIAGVVVFIILCVAACCCGADNSRQRRRSGGALRAYGAAMDVRAAAKGPDAYTRRLTRRAVFRTVRRW